MKQINFGLISLCGGILLILLVVDNLTIKYIEKFNFVDSLFILSFLITLLAGILSLSFERGHKNRIKMAIFGMAVVGIIVLRLLWTIVFGRGLIIGPL